MFTSFTLPVTALSPLHCYNKKSPSNLDLVSLALALRDKVDEPRNANTDEDRSRRQEDITHCVPYTYTIVIVGNTPSLGAQLDPFQ